MEQKFNQIKQEFKQFDEELHKNFRFVVRETEKGIWGAANLDNVFNFFQKIELQNFKNFLDLGCGDGRVVLVASLFTNATGIEIDKDLVSKGNEIKDKLSLNANLIRDDFYKHDISKYDTIFINPDTGFYNGLEDRLLKEMTGTLFVYNNIFMPRFLKRGRTHWFNQTPITEFKR